MSFVMVELGFLYVPNKKDLYSFLFEAIVEASGFINENLSSSDLPVETNEEEILEQGMKHFINSHESVDPLFLHNFSIH